MSWKATAFVKELRENLTVTDKFVLLMLAEYHRTDDKISWPSVRTLAFDCLMEERSVKRILARLEAADFIRRVSGGGRGHFTAYQIVGLDVPKGDPKSVIGESLSVQTLIGKAGNGDRNGDRRGSRNKEERVEPIKQPVTEICFKCEGKKQIFNYGPGDRIIDCPECCAPAVTH